MNETDLSSADPLTLGKRFRYFRGLRGLTLSNLSQQLDISISTLSLIETGKRLPRPDLLLRMSEVFEVSPAQLLQDQAPDERSSLEVQILQFQDSELFGQLGVEPLKLSSRLPTSVLHSVAGLYEYIGRAQEQRQAGTEEARLANNLLRQEMREKNNYFPQIEQAAKELLQVIDNPDQAITGHNIQQMAEYLGFRLIFTGSLPHSTRSVIDLEHGRIFLPELGLNLRNKTLALQSMGHIMLAHRTPKQYADFLRQRVQINYFAAAILMPEATVVPQLQLAKKQQDISIDDLREHFGVSFEMAAHRFTNLITYHLDIPVHFMRVHESGLIYKAYENDGLIFPQDNSGAIEGQRICRFSAARQAFEYAKPGRSYAQWTQLRDKRYWCTSRLELTPSGTYSITLGMPAEYSQWMRTTDKPMRSLKSGCPSPLCCSFPPKELSDKWRGKVWPSANVHSHLLAAIPPGVFPGVDDTAVFEFLEEQSESSQQ